MKQKSNSNNKIYTIIIVLLFLIFIMGNSDIKINTYKDKKIKVLSSYNNEYLEKSLKKAGYNLDITYMGDLDIVDELNNNSKDYDAVWISNSMWLYMLDNQYLTSESKSISISPVVVGIKRSKAKELDLIGKDVTNNEILDLVKNKKIKYIMPSVTSTNTGATSYIGFLNSLAGNPEILTEELLDNQKLINNLTDLFTGVERVSGDESYLKEMFLNSNDYEAIISDEATLININLELQNKKEETLYLLYPIDGVPINDMTLAFIGNDEKKKESFIELQDFLLSDEGKQLLEEKGYRTWYGGITTNTNNEIFNKEWGIDTNKYINVTNFPSKKVITKAINIYIENLRKPSHTIFCLDYSGSMYGSGIEELRDAMNYILDYEKSSEAKLQFSKKDKITVILFSSKVLATWKTTNGQNTKDLIDNINKYDVGGGTALYDAIIKGLDILIYESDDYIKTVIAMTDGEVNIGTFSELQNKYNKINKNIPVYSITFGSASEYELEKIADLTNAKVFDGKSGLLKAFKEVRSYN